MGARDEYTNTSLTEAENVVNNALRVIQEANNLEGIIDTRFKVQTAVAAMIRVVEPLGEERLICGRITERIASYFCRWHGIDLWKDRLAIQRLREAVDRAERELADVAEWNISIPFLTADTSGPKHLNYMLTRESVAEWVEDMIDRTPWRALPPPVIITDDVRPTARLDYVPLTGGGRFRRLYRRIRKLLGVPAQRPRFYIVRGV